MALLSNTTAINTTSLTNLPSLSILHKYSQSPRRSFRIRVSSEELDKENEIKGEKKLSKQSSWETKDYKGNDYLYRLGAEADNMNIVVGAKPGVIDDLFAGNVLGREADIVFDYRQKITRSFEYLQGDYYIAPLFLDKVGKFPGIN
ncbi:unnamed protein product [Amaranthus hypochondriacus]